MWVQNKWSFLVAGALGPSSWHAVWMLDLLVPPGCMFGFCTSGEIKVSHRDHINRKNVSCLRNSSSSALVSLGGDENVDCDVIRSSIKSSIRSSPPPVGLSHEARSAVRLVRPADGCHHFSATCCVAQCRVFAPTGCGFYFLFVRWFISTRTGFTENKTRTSSRCEECSHDPWTTLTDQDLVQQPGQKPHWHFVSVLSSTLE